MDDASFQNHYFGMKNRLAYGNSGAEFLYLTTLRLFNGYRTVVLRDIVGHTRGRLEH